MTGSARRTLRPASVGIFLLLALGQQVSVAAQSRANESDAPPGVRVRFPEGSAHGFLEMRNGTGAVIASGDLMQAAKGSAMEARIVLHFLDGSLFDESTLFTQQHTFRLQHYHLVQRGPAFDKDMDATLESSGKFTVKTLSHDDHKAKTIDGTIDEMPSDVSNGLPIVLAKNLTANSSRTVHLVAFMPKPRLVELEISPVGTQVLQVGQHRENAVDFRLKPKLGALVGFFAKLLGKLPPDSHAWIITGDAPAFVRFEGPMYLGPVWRLSLTAPSWPH